MDRSGSPFPSDLVFPEDHAWPGNVRELKNLVARRLAQGPLAPNVEPTSAKPIQDVSFFDELMRQDLSFSEARLRAIAEFERYFVLKALERHGGNVSKAAASAGIARRYFHRLKSRHQD
jgi:DNA-binding NtrC family response regulator